MATPTRRLVARLAVFIATVVVAVFGTASKTSAIVAAAATAAVFIVAVVFVFIAAVFVFAVGSTGGRRRLGFRSVVSRRTNHPSRGSAEVLCAGRAMRVATWLMPPAAPERWLGEADSFLFEALPGQRAAAVRNYLITAPQVIVANWAMELARRTRRRGRVAGTPQKAPRG